MKSMIIVLLVLVAVAVVVDVSTLPFLALAIIADGHDLVLDIRWHRLIVCRLDSAVTAPRG